MNMRLRFISAVLCLALSACEAQVGVDLSVADTNGLDSVVVDLAGVDLLAESGELYSVPASANSPVELRDLLDGEYLTLSDEHEVESTSYVGLSLDLGDSGNLVRLSDGREARLVPAVVTDFADITFDVDEGNSIRLVAVLDLRFSLYGNADEGFTLSPWLRVVDASRAASISGKLDAAAVESASCIAGREAGEGVAVYLYRGETESLTDFAAGLAGPYASAPVRSTDNGYVYDLPYLPAGTYTLGWTCSGDSDEPEARNGLLIETGPTLTLDDNDAVIVDL